MVGLISAGGDAVIGVHPVGHRLTVRRKMPEGEGGVVQQRSVGLYQYGTPSSPAEQERKSSERYNKTGIFAGKEDAGLVWAGGNGI